MPGLVVVREHFGYSDAFASVDDCTSGPWIAVTAAHGPLCKDLQRAGILESDSERESRVQGEILDRARSIQRSLGY